MRSEALFLGAACLVVAGCGSSSKGTASPGVRTFAVKITSNGCEPATLTVAPGPATFNVTNDGADSITEYELKQGDRIVGESENLTPGLDGSFTVTLKPGTYEAACPGGKSGTVTVSGDTSVTTAAAGGAVAQAVATYRTYVASETKKLVDLTRQFADAVEAGDVAKAKSLFPVARKHYETIEPVAESFGDLDPEIDARQGDVPDEQWRGFHRIEKALWKDGSLEGMSALAVRLVADVRSLDGKVVTLELEPAQIANGSVELLNEVAKSKITGEEDRYSHTDLWDFEANVAGARMAFDALRPIVAAKDAALAADVDAKFDAVVGSLDAYRQGDGFVSYTELTKSDTVGLAAKVDVLADALAKIAPLVAT